MDSESKKYTAFSTPDGHFEYQRICFAYLDDIIVFGSTLEDHNRNIVTLFERLRKTGLKLQPDKCEYLRPELEYLGHVITSEGVKPNSEKIKAVVNFKLPTTPTEVKSFLGLSGYYRKFILNYSTIAKPLTELTKENSTFKWTIQCQNAFDDLKHLLCSAPVLRYPDFSKEFTLTTDASNTGLGAILSQEGHPCCYISRTLNSPETNYSTTEKELLAIVWAVKRLRQYLLGRKFKILTDHQALKWLFNVKDPSSRLMRWRLKLEEYEYEIEYKKGSENQAADALSRIFPIQNDPLPTGLEKAILDLEAELPDIDVYEKAQGRDLVTPEIIEQPPRIPTPLSIQPLSLAGSEPESERPNEEKKKLRDEYYRWFSQPTETREVEKPNATGKLWRRLTKRETNKPSAVSMGMYHES